MATGTYESTFDIALVGDSAHGNLTHIATLYSQTSFLVGGYNLRGKVTGTELVYQQFFGGRWLPEELKLVLEGARLREAGTSRYYDRVSAR